MPNDALKESFSKLADALLRSERQSHASVVLSSAAILEQELELAIRTKMRPIDKSMSDRLFSGYGPISSFAAKIDLAFALDITTLEVHDELNKIRRIRNEIAHSSAMVSLDVEPLKTLFYKLKRPPGITGTYIQQFVACIIAIDDFLEAFLFRMGGGRICASQKESSLRRRGFSK